jgi:hypothetical protein
MRHRCFLAVPFLFLVFGTLIGGQLNTIDARGVVIDTSTRLPVAGVSITYGANRGAVSDDEGRYVIPNLPRDAHLKTTKPGYPPVVVAATDSQINLTPGSLSLQVNEEGTTDTRVPGIEVRQGDKVLTKCDSDPCGQLVIDLTTNNIVGQKALLCAPNHDSKEIDLKGVTLVTTLTKHEGVNCPPLPTPSPSPTPLPTASPSASPTPSPTASP